MASTFSRTYSTLALVAAMAAVPMMANAAPDGASDGMAPHHQRMQHGPGMQGQWGGHMLRGLDLSQDQQDQIFKIRHDQAQALYDQHKALRAAAKSLRDVTTADAFDDAKAKQAADALGQAQSQLALLRAETQAKVRAVLTPEQRQKLTERMSRRGHHGWRGGQEGQGGKS